MKQIAQSILDIDNGKMKEQANYELAKIMANLNDINANEKTKERVNHQTNIFTS